MATKPEQPSIFDALASTGAKPSTLKNARQSRVPAGTGSAPQIGAPAPAPMGTSTAGKNIAAGYKTGAGAANAIDRATGRSSAAPAAGGQPSLAQVAMLDTGVATDAAPAATGAANGAPDMIRPATGAGTTIMVENAGAGRHGEVSPALLNAVAARVEQAYGPGYTVVLRSGEGESSTGTQRHNSKAPDGGGIAGDFQIKAPDGHQLAGAELDPLGNTWIGVEGSMGINHKAGEKGSNWTHLDLVGGQNPAGRPLGPKEGTHWYYGSGKYTWSPERQVESQIKALGYESIEQFQEANVDAEGNPLEVDGKIGPMTTAAARLNFAANNIATDSPIAAANAAAPIDAQDATIAAAQPSLADVGLSPEMGYVDPGGEVPPAANVSPVPPMPPAPINRGPVIGSGAVITEPPATQVASAAPASRGLPGADPGTVDPFGTLNPNKDQSRIAPSQPSLGEIALQGSFPAGDRPTDGMASASRTDIVTPVAAAERPVLRRNSPDREAVMAAQAQIVKDMPWLGDQFIDGDYGPQTIGAVKAIQSKYGAKSVDGQIGPETWGILDKVEPVTFMPPERPNPNDPTLTGNRPLNPEMPGYRPAEYPIDGGAGGDFATDAGADMLGYEQPSLTQVGDLSAAMRTGAPPAAARGDVSAAMQTGSVAPPPPNPYDDWTRRFDIPGPETKRAEGMGVWGEPSVFDDMPEQVPGGDQPNPPSITSILAETGLDQQLMSLGWTPPPNAGAPTGADIAAASAPQSTAGQVAGLPGDMNLAGGEAWGESYYQPSLLTDLGLLSTAPGGQSPATFSLDSMPAGDAMGTVATNSPSVQTFSQPAGAPVLDRPLGDSSSFKTWGVPWDVLDSASMPIVAPPASGAQLPAPTATNEGAPAGASWQSPPGVSGMSDDRGGGVPIASPGTIGQPTLSDAGIVAPGIQSRSAVAGMSTGTPGVDPVTGQPTLAGTGYTGGGSSYIGGPPAGTGGTPATSSSGSGTGPAAGVSGATGGGSQPAYYDQASGSWQTWNGSSYQPA